MNVPAILGALKVIKTPSLCLPHQAVPTFADIPIHWDRQFEYQPGKHSDIKAVVLDKDNCFAVPNQDVVDPSCEERLRFMMKTIPAINLLIVSNSSGLESKDPDGSKAARLERNTGIQVLRHQQPKPGCGHEILTHFKDAIQSPSQILVIGDRLFTDIVMANRMNASSVWIKRGVISDNGILTRVEHRLSSFLWHKGFRAPEV